MMKRMRTFIKTSLLGGVAVVLPTTILILVFKWFFTIVLELIHPVTKLIVARAHFQVMAANAIVLGIILAACFIIGAIIKTKIGQFIHEHIDGRLAGIVPGYGMIRSTITQLLDRKKSPFSSVALVQAFDNDTLMTGFVTDEHADGSYTVFVPCGPNPTTGFIFHLKPQYVQPIKAPVEDAFRSVISCGAGSKSLIAAFHRERG